VGKKSRAEGSAASLRELNSYVDVAVADSFDIADVGKYSLICVTENLVGLNKLIEWNEAARKAKVGFILAETLGAMIYTFVDYHDHVIFDADGEQTKSYIISAIQPENENATMVTVHEDKRHSYQDGDHVVFREIEGMVELNDREPVEVFDCRAYDFKIKLDATKFAAYTRQGLVEDKKVPKHLAYKSLAESIKNPAAASKYGALEMPDLKLFGRSEQLHLAIYAVHIFRDEHGKMPCDNKEDLDKVVAIAKNLAADLKAKELHCVEEAEEDVVRKVAAYSSCSITSMCAFLGGFIA
jgi:ubiquitin-activating enzyme E1